MVTPPARDAVRRPSSAASLSREGSPPAPGRHPRRAIHTGGPRQGAGREAHHSGPHLSRTRSSGPRRCSCASLEARAVVLARRCYRSGATRDARGPHDDRRRPDLVSFALSPDGDTLAYRRVVRRPPDAVGAIALDRTSRLRWPAPTAHRFRSGLPTAARSGSSPTIDCIESASMADRCETSPRRRWDGRYLEPRGRDSVHARARTARSCRSRTTGGASTPTPGSAAGSRDEATAFHSSCRMAVAICISWPKHAIRGVYVGSLDGPERRRLFDADAAAVLMPPSSILFLRGRHPVRAALRSEYADARR